MMNDATPDIQSNGFNIGIRRISRAYLQAHFENSSMLNLKVVGLAIIDEDIPAELAKQTLHRVKVYGMLIASLGLQVALNRKLKVIGICTDHQPSPVSHEEA